MRKRLKRRADALAGIVERFHLLAIGLALRFLESGEQFLEAHHLRLELAGGASAGTPHQANNAFNWSKPRLTSSFLALIVCSSHGSVA